jgi:hypothetical protein
MVARLVVHATFPSPTVTFVALLHEPRVRT